MEDKKLNELTDEILNKVAGGIKRADAETRGDLDGSILCLNCEKKVWPERINGVDYCPLCNKPL